MIGGVYQYSAVRASIPTFVDSGIWLSKTAKRLTNPAVSIFTFQMSRGVTDHPAPSQYFLHPYLRTVVNETQRSYSTCRLTLIPLFATHSTISAGGKPEGCTCLISFLQGGTFAPYMTLDLLGQWLRAKCAYLCPARDGVSRSCKSLNGHLRCMDRP